MSDVSLNLRDIFPAFGFGIGLVVGVGGALLISRWTRGQSQDKQHELVQIATSINGLRKELKELKTTIQEDRHRQQQQWESLNLKRNRRGNSKIIPSSTSAASFISANTSASSEDEFEDVYSETDEPRYERITTAPDSLLYKDAPDSQDTTDNTDSAPRLIEEVDELFIGTYDDMDRALDIMRREAPKYPDNAQVLWRFAKAKVLVGEVAKSRGEDEIQKILVYEARDHAERAVLLDDLDAEAHKYYSITQGIISDWVALSEAITIGKSFKVHLERALQLKPSDAYISHLYGRFIYTLAKMSWLQRKTVVTLYGLTESVTFDTALTWFKKAEALEPGFSNCNPFYMAECYIQLGGDTSEVPELLENAISFQGNSVEEVELREKAAEMLQQYR